MNRLLPVLILAALPACTCTTPTPPDAGCTGEQCDLDSGFHCTRDEDCAPLSCVIDTGQCAARDAGITIDAGDPDLCTMGETQTCGVSSLGECRLGVRGCLADDAGVFHFGTCAGAVLPTSEVCDGKDNDCDGDFDEGFGVLTCGMGACRRALDSCLGGTPQTCTPGTPGLEVCNGLDDDCDGMTDEDQPMLTCGTGECRRTVASCLSGTPQTCAAGTPSPELCDGKDNDCDSLTDDGFGEVTCGVGACRRTISPCVAGMPRICVPGMASPEVCDGLDNNCDGAIDEGCACLEGQTRACYSGPPGTSGSGICRGGTQSCLGGTWRLCVGEIIPRAETCNGTDDDCDGLTDENFGMLSCGTGACLRTAPACLNGATQTCTPGAPGLETCNGVDDDCDTVTDEGLGVTSCGAGECARVVPACVNGVTQSCQAGVPGAEVCDGRDNDCDGSIDETFPQSNLRCGTGLAGLCGPGAYMCAAGALSCRQTVMPSTEICSNGIDEDCSGQPDDGPTCCVANVDHDGDGANGCADCNDNDGSIHPGGTELCNGKDDDCDGLIDEGFDADGDGFTRCGTRQGGGLDPQRADCNDADAYVFPFKPFDCGDVATPNTRNTVDDNCNGYVDETCSCSPQDRDGDGFSQCDGDCDDNDPAIAPGRQEVCDGKDNDCNAATVQNCGVSERCGARTGVGWQRFADGTDTCRADLVCVTNVVTGELTCGSFCNQTPGSGLGDSCGPQEGCVRNLVDSANQHLCAVVPVGTRSTGAVCSASSDCRSGDCVTNDGPTDYCADRCTHERGCSGNTTCVVNEGQVTNGPFVIGAYLHGTCRLDANVAGTRTTGQSCSGTSICRAGTVACFDGGCVEPCCEHADCGAGFACSVNGPVRATGFQTAAMDSIVSVMPSCLPSTATKESGQVCASSAECRSGLCDAVLGTCADLCCNDASCPNGTTCEPVRLSLRAGQVTLVRACVFSPVPERLQQR